MDELFRPFKTLFAGVKGKSDVVTVSRLHHGSSRRPLVVALVASSLDALATPQFARTLEKSCNACHAVVPRLNAHGLAFAADGYVLPALARSASTADPGSASKTGTIPLAAWITVRHEDRGGSNAADLYLPKVELISGGPVTDSLSYFAEWRIVSQSLSNDGSLTDRSGRFEDLFLDWRFARGHAVKVGQFRSLNQVDVSQRLSVDEPLLFNNTLVIGTSTDARVSGLERMSPSGRSPGISWAWRSGAGETASDGLFHFVTVPFVGEFSIPLGPEASDRASFELHDPKGVYVETFYRRGLRSVGLHAFYDDRAWLATLVGTLDWRNLVLTGGAGVDDRDAGASRLRGSLEAEYLIRRFEHVRAAVGLRGENVGADGLRTRVVPYVALAAPNTRHTYLFQAQYIDQDGSDTLVFDLSAIF